MKKGKIILAILFLCLLSLIGYEITHVYGVSNHHNISLPNSDTNISGGIDKTEVKSSKFKKLLAIEGWAYIDNIDAEQQNVFIVLLSETNRYVFDTEKVLRGDLPTALSDQNNKVENAGFNGLIDTSNIESGSYQIGYYIQNGDSKELSYSGISVTKENNDKIEFKEILNNALNIKIDKATNEIQANIEEFKNENGIFKIKGWGYLENVSPEDSDIYIALKEKDSKKLFVFDTQFQIRKDVTAYFGGKSDLDKSGFTSKISKEIIGDGEFQLGIYIKNGPLAGLYWSEESIGE